MKPVIRLTIAATVIGYCAVKESAKAIYKRCRANDDKVDRFIDWLNK